MPDFNLRSDSVNVEQIMAQIRSRIREKRGVDYTEEQIRELAQVKLEKFLDPRGVRSDLLAQFQSLQQRYEAPELPKYVFEDETLYETHRGPLRFIRRLLHPILKLLFNPNPLIQALHIQAHLNKVSLQREVELENSRRALEQLHYEMLHNVVLEMTRLGIEAKNLKMRVESLTGRLDFNERRARALERTVAYQPAADSAPVRPPMPPPRAAPRTTPPPPPPPRDREPVPAAEAVTNRPPGVEGASADVPEGPGQRSRRRRRRRGRRGGAPAAVVMGGEAPSGADQAGDPAGEASPAERPLPAQADQNESRPVPLIEHAMANEVHPTEPFSATPPPESRTDDDGSDQS